MLGLEIDGKPPVRACSMASVKNEEYLEFSPQRTRWPRSVSVASGQGSSK